MPIDRMESFVPNKITSGELRLTVADDDIGTPQYRGYLRVRVEGVNGSDIKERQYNVLDYLSTPKLIELRDALNYVLAYAYWHGMPQDVLNAHEAAGTLQFPLSILDVADRP